MPRKNRSTAPRAPESISSTKPPVKTDAEVTAEAQEQKAARVAKPVSTGETVTIGLKLPNGLILQLQSEQDVRFPVMGGGFHVEKQMRPDYSKPSYTLHGNRFPFGEQPRCLIVGGFAMTPGIPLDFWKLWREQNKDLDLVKSGLIFAQETADSARDEAKDKATLRSGLEPLSQKNDPRVDKRRDREGKLVDTVEAGERS